MIREREPHRKIVVGSNMWQHVDTFHQLKVPDDQDIILSFHFYRPHIFTHYICPGFQRGMVRRSDAPEYRDVHHITTIRLKLICNEERSPA